MNDLDCAADFITELILLCDMSKEAQQKLLRPIKIGVGDYIGSGYALQINSIKFMMNLLVIAVKNYGKKLELL